MEIGFNTKEFYKQIGSRIEEARLREHLTQEIAAERLGVARVTWNHIENGNGKLSVDRLFLISRLLNTSFTRLIPELDKEGIDISSADRTQTSEKEDIFKKLDEIKKELKGEQS